MKEWTVSELARLASISVRALHHYDEIGLLVPARVGENRYRYYGEEELLRLQQILLYRALGLPLDKIGAILDDPHFDGLTALQEQRHQLEAEAKRYRQLVRTIDRTIAHLKGERAMKHEDLYKGFLEPQKQAEYETWLKNHLGESSFEKIAARDSSGNSIDDRQIEARMRDLAGIEAMLVKAMQDGTVPEARALDTALERHRTWVSDMWNRPCTPSAYAGLADIYERHPDFVQRYEALGKGFSRWLPAAMRAGARRMPKA